jgi:hypothetical protein
MTNKDVGFDWLLDLFAFYNTLLQLQSRRYSHTPLFAVHVSIRHFIGCFSNCWN